MQCHFFTKTQIYKHEKHLLFYIFLFLNSFSISGQTKNKITDSLLREMTDSIFSKHHPAVHSVLISKGNQLVY